MANILYDALTATRQDPQQTFLIIPDQPDWTWGQFLGRAAQFAHALVAAGVTKGDRVAVQVPKSADAYALYLGCLQCGAVFLPMNTAYTPAEVTYFIDDAEPAVFVCEPASEAPMMAALSRADLSSTIMTLGDADQSAGSSCILAAANASEKTFATVSVAGDELAAILYTSGTTGRSKGAMLSHNNLLSNARTLQAYWEFTADDVLLNALPIYHTHGLFTAGNTLLLSGGKMIFCSRFVADEVVQLLPQATTMMGVPTFYTRLLDLPAFTREVVQHMRLFISGSAPMLAETHHEFEHRTGQRILERYGMTETSMNTSNPYHGDRRAGSVGFALPDVEVRIIDPDSDATCAVDEIGMIQVKGPNVFGGYWRMPEKTAEEMTDDGFFITGDLGLIDSDGYVHIVGRGKDLIICGGFNVYPKEVELLLDEQPGVLESAVVGAPHPDFGESVVAFVVADGITSLDADVLQGALADQLAKFKQPRLIHTIEALPRNAMGKVQKNVLREQVQDSFTA